MANLSALFSRLKLIAAGGASRIIISLNSVISSFMIIRWESSARWGELVIYLLFLDFGFSIIAWGSSPYLVREFSFYPKDIGSAWSKSFNARIPLLITFLFVILFSPFAPSHKIALVIWAVARYLYHSFEPVIQYQRSFLFSLAVEVVGLLIILTPLAVSPGNINIDALIYIFAANMIWKAIATVAYFKNFISFSWPEKKYYSLAFPFLLLTFSAMLQQRSDLYGVAYYLPQEDTARYQVFINLLLFSQFFSSLLLSPFAKNIFRLPDKSFRKLERRFMALGIPLSAVSLAGVYILIRWFYQLELSWPMYALGYFYVLAFYFYLLKNYHLGKIHQQTRVAVYSFIASGINVAMSMALIPVFHLEGAIIAGVVTQFALVLLYHYPISVAHGSR